MEVGERWAYRAAPHHGPVQEVEALKIGRSAHRASECASPLRKRKAGKSGCHRPGCAFCGTTRTRGSRAKSSGAN